MGYYINPTDMTKEDFLCQHGTPIMGKEAYVNITEDRLPVCLVDNGFFTAAGIAYSAGEVDVFLHPDGRPKKWFSVPRAALKPWYDR